MPESGSGGRWWGGDKIKKSGRSAKYFVWTMVQAIPCSNLSSLVWSKEFFDDLVSFCISVTWRSIHCRGWSDAPLEWVQVAPRPISGPWLQVTDRTALKFSFHSRLAVAA